MKFTLSIAAFLIALSCLAEEPVPYYKTEAFKQQYEARMRQYVASREKKIEEIKKSFHSEILPAVEKLKPSLEFGRLTEREEDWPPEFKKYEIRFIQVSEGQVWLYFHKWVSKAEAVVYYFDPSKAPKKEDTKADGEAEKKRPNPEKLRLFDDLWYWSFRG
tara:strand:- start:911 stop:1393 length:483 start_codon:yes stop_codon:yes gene_type:complete